MHIATPRVHLVIYGFYKEYAKLVVARVLRYSPTSEYMYTGSQPDSVANGVDTSIFQM